MTDLTWTSSTRKLSDLTPWELNPKQITESQQRDLTASIAKFGFALPMLIDPANELLDGHQRSDILNQMEEYGADYEVPVRVASRPLTMDERRELTVRLKENQADWDFDAMQGLYGKDELVAWGLPEWRIEWPDIGHESPAKFEEYDEEIETEFRCPKCGYEWSGKAR